MANEDLIKFIAKFKDKKIGVVGDLLLDHFISGDVERISPEAPVPVLIVEKEVFIVGGAGNVAMNIASLGGKVFVSGSVGKDDAGKILLKEFKRKNKNIDTVGIIKVDSPTIRKTRVVARGQQLVRMDLEKEYILSDNKQAEKKIISFVSSHIKNWDALVISNYAKGLMTKKLAEAIINSARKYKKQIIVDTKPKHADFFKNITIITPNDAEAMEIAGVNDVMKAGKIIQRKLNCNVLITQGPRGMTLFEEKRIEWLPTKAKEVFDVTGAGDTVMAALTLSLASGLSLKQAIVVANHAAGIVVGKRGTAVVSAKELENDLRANG